MTDARPGLRIMHNGVAIELLHQVSATATEQVWWCKMLFVAKPNRNVTIKSTDRCSRIHSEFTMHLRGGQAA